jgi:hypothetical protein
MPSGIWWKKGCEREFGLDGSDGLEKGLDGLEGFREGV